MADRLDENVEYPPRKLCDAWRILGNLGYIDTIFNHISVAWVDESGETLVSMNPEGFLATEVVPARMVTFALQADQRAGPCDLGVNEDGFILHTRIHLTRGMAGVVLHTHSAFAVAVGATSLGLLPISQTAIEFVANTKVVEYSGLFRNHGDDKVIDKFCMDGGVAFLRNHGTLIVADQIEEAVYMQHYFEEACRTQVLALSQGREMAMPTNLVIANTAAGLARDRKKEAAMLFAALRRNL
jgi:ribulose-5-phosphate 4-epimerase/fuculose-1-phosphate aldolase